MIIYRPHRGSLKEAMELRKIFKTEAEMFEYISNQSGGAVSIDDLSIGEILGDDPPDRLERLSVCAYQQIR